MFGGLVGRDRGVEREEGEVLFVVYCVYWACIWRGCVLGALSILSIW